MGLSFSQVSILEGSTLALLSASLFWRGGVVGTENDFDLFFLAVTFGLSSSPLAPSISVGFPVSLSANNLDLLRVITMLESFSFWITPCVVYRVLCVINPKHPGWKPFSTCVLKPFVSWASAFLRAKRRRGRQRKRRRITDPGGTRTAPGGGA